MEERYKKKISWDVECEQYTPLFPSDSGLPVSIYLDDGYAAVSSGHPTVVFVQNSYNHFDTSYKNLICVSVDDTVENVFDTELLIKSEDYIKVCEWIVAKQDLIHSLSMRYIDIFGFLKECKRRNTIDVSSEKCLHINTIKGSTEEYVVVKDTENNKCSLISKRTDENVLNDRWFDSILPTIKQNGEKELIAVWDNEKVMYIQINKTQ